MKGKRIFLIAWILAGLMLSSCETSFGSKHVDDPGEYGKWESYLEIPSFLPASVEGYQVNGYSYTLLAYMDICYEIFLDISVTEEQLEGLLSEGRLFSEDREERAAYYHEGYFEIVFLDEYTVYHEEMDDTECVGFADIEKIVYNPETRNVVYVCLHANDTGVYPLHAVEYFNRFLIKEEEYVRYCT